MHKSEKVRRAISMSIFDTLKDGFPIYLDPIGTLQFTNGKGKQKSTKTLTLIRKRKGKNAKILDQIQKDFKLNKPQAKQALQAYSKILEKNLKKHCIVTIPQVGIISITNKGKHIIKTLNSLKSIKKDNSKSAKNKSKKKSKRPKSLPTTAKLVSKIEEIKKDDLIDSTLVKTVSSTTVEKDTRSIDQELLDGINELDRIEHDIQDKDELKEVLKDHFYQDDEHSISLEKNRILEKKSETPAPETLSHRSYTTESNYKPWVIGILSTLGFIALVYFGLKLFTSPTSGSNDQTKELGLFTPEDTEIELASAPTFLDEASINKTEKCVIITGTFSQIYNEEQMRNLIISHGYDPYTEQHNGLTRVGLKIECTEEDVDDILNDIKNKISDKAWFLYPPDF